MAAEDFRREAIHSALQNWSFTYYYTNPQNSAETMNVTNVEVLKYLKEVEAFVVKAAMVALKHA